MQSRTLVCDWQKQQYFSHVHFDSERSHWEQTVIISRSFLLGPRQQTRWPVDSRLAQPTSAFRS